MNEWSSKRMPIAVVALPGEALDSWLEAYACKLHLNSRDLLNFLGIPTKITRLVIALRPEELTAIAEATGVSPAHLNAMTLRQFDAIAVNLDLRRRAQVHPPAWRRHKGSRYCPECLRDQPGRWPLIWRLPWSFACPYHDQLLADYCPGCNLRAHAARGSLNRRASKPNECANSAPINSGRRGTCNYPLTDAPSNALPPGSLTIKAQQHLHQLVLNAAAHPSDPPPRTALTGLAVLAHQALAALNTTPGQLPNDLAAIIGECGNRVPRAHKPLDSFDSQAIAVGTAFAVLAHKTNWRGDRLLAWLIEADQRRYAKPEPLKLIGPYRNTTPQLLGRVIKVLDTHLLATHRLSLASAGRNPSLPKQNTDRSGKVPTLLWPNWALHLLPPSDTGPARFDTCRTALSAMTLMARTSVSYAEATQALGGYASRTGVRMFIAHTESRALTAIMAGVIELADRLDAAAVPIDYNRRRRLFPAATTHVDVNAYNTFASSMGWPPAGRLQQTLLDQHLYLRLTGSHAADRTGRTLGPATGFDPFATAIPRAVRTFIDSQADKLLNLHNICEPITWSPELPAARPLTSRRQRQAQRWRGMDPRTVDQALFVNALAKHRTKTRAVKAIRDETGLASNHIRLLGELIEPDLPANLWNSLASDQELLDPARITDLYQEQRMSLAQIARASLTTESAIRAILADEGITVGRRGSQLLPVNRQLFDDRYNGKGKTVKQLSAETGYSCDTLYRGAKRLGVNTTPDGLAKTYPFTALPENCAPTTLICDSCRTERDLRYLRNILTAVTFPSKLAAAKHLAVPAWELHRQIKRVQRNIRHHGITIFQRIKFLPTAAGAVFLDQAAEALELLDLHRNAAPKLDRHSHERQ